jgi:hypothetical protein
MPKPEYEVYSVAADTVLTEMDVRHFPLGFYETLAEAQFHAEKVADLSPTGLPVRIYYNGALLMEVNKGATQPSLFV